MRASDHRRSSKPATTSDHSQPPEVSPTVASLGVQARLIPADADWDRELAHLITSCEAARAEFNRLFEQMIALLAGAGRSNRERPLTPPSDNLDGGCDGVR